MSNILPPRYVLFPHRIILDKLHVFLLETILRHYFCLDIYTEIYLQQV